MLDRLPGGAHDDLAQVPVRVAAPCACYACLDARIREIESQIGAMGGVSAATYSVAVKPLEERLDELRRLRRALRGRQRAGRMGEP